MSEAIFIGTIIPLFFLTVTLKEENRLLMLFFTWGIIAFALSLTINNALISNFLVDIQRLSITWAPIIEELIKAFPLGYFLFKREKKFPIACFGIAIGIGFSIQENYVYLLEHLRGDASPILYSITRSLTTCLLHGTTTGIIGYGISLVRKLSCIIWPLLFGLYALGVTLHALYNLYVYSRYNYIGMSMPICLYLLGYTILKCKKSQG